MVTPLHHIIECQLWKIWKNHSPRCPKIHFQRFYHIKLSFFCIYCQVEQMELMLMELVSTHWHRLWLCHKFLGSMFSKDLQPFDSIKHNIIRKLAYKVKYNSQINGSFDHVLRKFKNKIFLKLVGFFVNNIGRIQEKGTQST